MDFLNKFDKQKLQRITLIVIAALTLLALVLLLVIIIGSVDPHKKNINADVALSEGYSDSELTTYTVTDKNIAVGNLVLANTDHPFSISNPDWLGAIDCKAYRNSMLSEAGINYEKVENLPYLPYNNMQLRSEAMINAHEMISAAVEAIGNGSITIDGAYNRQENKVNIPSEKLNEFDTALLIFLSDKESDGTQNIYAPLSDSYEKWLNANCTDYGFVQSFKYGYRYVGIAHAKAMTKLGYDLEEYLEYLKAETSVQKTLTITLDDESSYKIYYVSCKAGDEINVPSNGLYSISGTNEGGVVVTVKVN